MQKDAWREIASAAEKNSVDDSKKWMFACWLPSSLTSKDASDAHNQYHIILRRRII